MSVQIIAEVGSVHDGSFGNAKKLIEAASECGADAVKFQTHIASAETLKNAPMPPYFKGEPRYEYFERTGFTLPQWKELKAHADSIGIEFLSSPFSIEAVDLLEEVSIKRYKVPSGEVTNVPLLERIAKTKKPVLLSSGMSDWKELDRAVEVFKNNQSEGAGLEARLTMLQCTSAYPCPYESVGLNVLAELRERYKCPVGLSDHTLTSFSSFAAVTLGATVIEKHLTFSRKMYGSDAPLSLEPPEFCDLTKGIRAIETMMRHPVKKGDLSHFKTMKEIFEKSVVSRLPIAKGAVITGDMLACKKPGTGIPAAKLPNIIGQKAACDIPVDRLLTEKDFI